MCPLWIKSGGGKSPFNICPGNFIFGREKRSRIENFSAFRASSKREMNRGIEFMRRGGFLLLVSRAMCMKKDAARYFANVVKCTTIVVKYTTNMNVTIEKLFGSRIRAKILGWLFTHTDESFFVRQLSSIILEDPTNLLNLA
jgi:hypothetical protein